MHWRAPGFQRPLDLADTLACQPEAFRPGMGKQLSVWRSWRWAARRLTRPSTCLAALAAAFLATLLASETIGRGLLTFGGLWLVAEAAFVAFQQSRYRAHNRIRAHPVPHHDPEATFLSFLGLKDHIDIKNFLGGWFHNAEFDDIQRENIKDLIYYGFFYVTREEAKGTAIEASVQKMVELVELNFDVRFPEGHNPSLKIMMHLWEPLKVTFRPLAFYVATELVGVLSHLLLFAMGFRQHEEHKVVYWIRAPGKQGPDAEQHPLNTGGLDQHANGGEPFSQAPPVVFFHGVGFGLLPYLPFLGKLWSDLPRRRFLLVETRHVAMRLCWESTHADEIGHGIAAVLEKLNCSSACFMGHSYGTLLMARCLQLHPQLCSSAVFLDPVCMLVLHPKLLSNFIYDASFRTAPFHKEMLRHFIATELTVAESMCRKFWWHTFMAWPRLLPKSTLVVLSELDNLVPVPEVLSLMESMGHVEVIRHPERQHGDLLFDKVWQQEIIDGMRHTLTRTALPPCAI